VLKDFPGAAIGDDVDRVFGIARMHNSSAGVVMIASPTLLSEMKSALSDD